MAGTSSAKIRSLLSSLRKTSPTGKYFFIYDDLQAKITKELVFDATSSSIPLHCRPENVELIMKKGLQLFCSLVWIQQEDHITQFLAHNSLDERLPIAFEAEVNRIAPDLDPRFYTEAQWEFCPWHFDKGSTHMILPDDAVLPFVDETVLTEGADGEISIVSLPGTLQSFVDPKNSATVTIVRKQIKRKKNPERTHLSFRQERECLELYHTLRHSNIIQLFGSFTLKGDHNLLFPLFSMDLATFLAEKTRYREFHQNATFYAALSGLASAMEAVHNYKLRSRMSPVVITGFGYHHDIRPANILVTPTTFILTDFGLAVSEPENRKPPPLWKTNRGDYIAPECMNEEMDHQRVGRSYDVWSFGCLVAEVATYMEYGPAGLTEFRKQRRSLYYFEEPYINCFFFEGHSVKRGVSDWLAKVSLKPQDCVIRSLVSLSSDMLRVDIQDRPTATSTVFRLGLLHTKRLFQDAREIFEEILADLSNAQCEVSHHTLLELKIESSKLRSFGVALGMENHSSADCKLFKEPSFSWLVQQKLERISDSLRRFRDAGNQNVHIWTTYETQSGAMKDYIPRKFIDQQLTKDIKQICEAVPASYQQYMTQLSLQYILESNQSDTSLESIVKFTEDSPERCEDLGVHAAMKRLEHALWHEMENADQIERELILDSSQIQNIRTFSPSHQLGIFTYSTAKTPVLIEWVLFSKFEEGQQDEERIGKILIFAGLLCAPKPKNFHVLNCLGFIPPKVTSDHQGFGFVYTFPSASGTDLEDEQDPTTFRSLLSDTKFSITLEDRFHMAKCLTSSLYELHFHRWLHKNIRSDNIIFCPDGRSGNTVAGSRRKLDTTPYLIGFYHSRPDSQVFYSESNDAPSDPSSPLYQHPEYQHNFNRFQKKYDYYSIGIILLEIAFWRPIDVIKAKCDKDKEKALDSQGFRDKLIHKYVPALAEVMGSAFKDAVLACLTSNFSRCGLDSGEEDDLSQFYWTVVERLAFCRVV